MSQPSTATEASVLLRAFTLLGASLLVGAVTALALPVFAPSGADAGFSYRVAVDADGPVTDGQAVTVTVTAPPGTRVTQSGFCHPDMPAPTSQAVLTEWCTSTVGNATTSGTEPADPDGVVTLSFRAGVGVAEKTSPALGTSRTWRCDETSACRVALEVMPPTGGSVFDTSVVLTYKGSDPTGGCGGPAPDQFATAAPDRLTEAWVAWTVAECAGEGTSTGASFTNDGAALGQFASGGVDLAYSGVPAGTEGFGEATRPAVQTPLALNATVLAVAGFQPEPSSVPGTPLWKPIDDVRMSTEEVNALLSGRLTLDEGLQDSLKARNPQLAEQGTSLGFAMPNGLAGPQATTEVMSRLLEGRMGDAWAYPNLPSKYGDSAGDPLGTFADYNGIDNSLAMINLLTGKPQMVGDIFKKLSEKPQAVSLVHFFLTDVATARQLGITPVALPDGVGEWVLPTPASISAAGAAMTRSDDGTWALPESLPTGAYPLTFVEYAVTPEQKLLDDACAPLEGATTALRSWVDYLVGDGQGAVDAAGLVPLPAQVREAAAASVATIATADATVGSCAPEPPPEEEEGATPPPVSGEVPTGTIPTGGSIPDGTGRFEDPSGPGAPGAGDGAGPGTGTVDVPTDPTDGRAATPDATSIDDAQAVASSTRIPRLEGPLGAGVLVATVTLVGLVSLTSATGWLPGGRRRRPPAAP